MSLFPRYVNLNQEFSPLFRLLDDYATATSTSRAGFPSSHSIRAFQPKFDVKETKEAYELHGELPGVDQKDISIEWQDSSTITISGRVEHRSERGQRPAGYVTEGEEAPQKQLEGHEYQKPSVEEEGAEGSKQPEEQQKSEEQSTEVTKASGSQEVAQQQQQADDHKYWVTERSVGEFHRSFSFPTRIDQDSVKANLKNGVLTITVPKAKAKAPRKINIE